jgi:hypothetical protein
MNIATIRMRAGARLCLPAYSLLLLLLAVWPVAACGGSSPTEPTPSPSPSPPPSPGPILIHSTLIPSEDRSATRLFLAYLKPGGVFVNEYYGVWDDFTPAVSAQVRTVRWQGGYCDARYLVPPVVPPAVARSFRIRFSDDFEGWPLIFRPNTAPPIDVNIPISQMREEKMFDVDSPDLPCGRDGTPQSYYSYSTTLPTPLPVVGGRRYWIRVDADVGNSEVAWGWRIGTGGDGRSISHVSNAVWLADMAFSLSQ